MLHLQLVFISSLLIHVLSDQCPSGGQIYNRGLNEADEDEVTRLHNEFRLQIAHGLVPNQPMGTNLRKMKYDRALGESARVVSDSCIMEHILGTDDRWRWVGQNLYIEWSSLNTSIQNWENAVTSWFVEHVDFHYPNISNTNTITGHYTQVVWADTDHVGCDFINFYDTDPRRTLYPYAKLYSCNYGPGGNIIGQPPYEIDGINECPDLC